MTQLLQKLMYNGMFRSPEGDGGAPLDPTGAFPESEPSENLEAEGEGGEAPQEPVVEADPPAAPEMDESWKIKAFDKNYAKMQQFKRELDEARASLASGKIETTTPEAVQAEIDKQSDIKAKQIAEVNSFTAACNDTLKKGIEEYPDFQSRVNNLVQVARGMDAQQQYNTFLLAAIRTGQAHKIIHSLGNQPREMARLLELDPIGMAVEVSKMANGVTPKAETQAPKPIKTASGARSIGTSIDPTDPTRAMNLSTEEWMRRRTEQVGGNTRTRRNGAAR